MDAFTGLALSAHTDAPPETCTKGQVWWLIDVLMMVDALGLEPRTR
jgi:hypothetical protein